MTTQKPAQKTLTAEQRTTLTKECIATLRACVGNHPPMNAKDRAEAAKMLLDELRNH